MVDAEALTTASIVMHGEDVVAKEVDGEVVALNVKRGFCFGLNRTGSRVWQLASRPISVSEICARLVEEFKVDAAECERDVLALLAGLRSDGLIVSRAELPAAA